MGQAPTSCPAQSTQSGGCRKTIPTPCSCSPAGGARGALGSLAVPPAPGPAGGRERWPQHCPRPTPLPRPGCTTDGSEAGSAGFPPCSAAPFDYRAVGSISPSPDHTAAPGSLYQGILDRPPRLPRLDCVINGHLRMLPVPRDQSRPPQISWYLELSPKPAPGTRSLATH